MRTKEAEAVFNGRMGIVRALGNRTKAAIYAWGDVVPFKAATELAQLDSRLQVDHSLYNQFGHIRADRAA